VDNQDGEEHMNIIRTFKTEHLGFSMPPIEGLETMTAAQHYDSFYAFDTCNVWTADGWLVTAVQDDRVSHHLRKGNDVVVAKLDPSTPLYFKHTPKSLHYTKMENT
jgi:hypothetical protein